MITIPMFLEPIVLPKPAVTYLFVPKRKRSKKSYR